MPKIKNINGTSDAKCKCGSWLDHWKKFGGASFPQFCSEAKCIGKDLVGAHVQKADVADNNWYIIPLCSKHNLSKETLEVVSSTVFVSANRKETCEK